MINEDTGEEICCPLCDSIGDCEHRLAAIDMTFGEIFGGYAYHRVQEFQDRIEKKFKEISASSSKRKIIWKNIFLAELWECCIDDEGMMGAENIYVDSYVFHRMLADVFQDKGAEEYVAIEEGGLGCSSAVSLLYAESPKVVFEKSLQDLQESLAQFDSR